MVPLQSHLSRVIIQICILFEQPAQLLGAFLESAGDILNLILNFLVFLSVCDTFQLGSSLNQISILILEPNLLLEELIDFETCEFGTVILALINFGKEGDLINGFLDEEADFHIIYFL